MADANGCHPILHLTKEEMMKISPLFKNGDIRVKLYGRLPDEVKEGLRAIAKSENQSISWTVEQVIIDYFGLKQPRYKVKKNGKII